MFAQICKLNEKYPIYNNEDEIIGYTDENDTIIITDVKSEWIYDICKAKYEYYTIIISGEYIGYNSLVLDESDVDKLIDVESKF